MTLPAIAGCGAGQGLRLRVHAVGAAAAAWESYEFVHNTPGSAVILAPAAGVLAHRHSWYTPTGVCRRRRDGRGWRRVCLAPGCRDSNVASSVAPDVGTAFHTTLPSIASAGLAGTIAALGNGFELEAFLYRAQRAGVGSFGYGGTARGWAAGASASRDVRRESAAPRATRSTWIVGPDCRHRRTIAWVRDGGNLRT